MKFIPSYIPLYATGEFHRRLERLEALLESCTVCPHDCGNNRMRDELARCYSGRLPIVSSYCQHFGEEPALGGMHGVGNIFLGNCNLRCVYCQNYEISQLREGKEVSARELAEMMLSLQDQGCHNINLVTPSHQVPQILEGLLLAAQSGLRVPLVYNTSSYDDLDTLRLLDGIVDIYLPDFKYANAEAGLKYSKVPGYPEIAKGAIKEMHRQTSDLVIDERGLAVKGLLVRHLVLPGGLAGTGAIMRFLAEDISKDTYVNIMDQYRPCWKSFAYPPLDRPITTEECEEAVEAAKAAGLHRLHHERPGSAVTWIAEV